jgi:hypothetical protein
MVTRIIDGLIAVIALTGCTAILPTAVSTPIWLIVGILYLSRPAWRGVWRVLTALHVLSLGFIGFWGLFSTLEGLRSYRAGIGGLENYNITLTVAIFGMTLAIFSWVALKTDSRIDQAAKSGRSGVFFQIIVALIAWAFTTWLAMKMLSGA